MDLIICFAALREKHSASGTMIRKVLPIKIIELHCISNQIDPSCLVNQRRISVDRIDWRCSAVQPDHLFIIDQTTRLHKKSSATEETRSKRARSKRAATRKDKSGKVRHRVPSGLAQCISLPIPNAQRKKCHEKKIRFIFL